jgi:hypothetical protein
MSNNKLGEIVPPAGWKSGTYNGGKYQKVDGSDHETAPPGWPGKPEGVIAIANAIPAMRALSSVNLLKNNISVEQAQELLKIMLSHKNLTTLCGLSGEETELDMSGKMSGAGDAIMLAPEINDNGAMTSLNLALNYVRDDGAKIIAKAIKVTKCSPAIIVVPFLCPSDFSINCCCLL